MQFLYDYSVAVHLGDLDFGSDLKELGLSYDVDYGVTELCVSNGSKGGCDDAGIAYAYGIFCTLRWCGNAGGVFYFSRTFCGGEHEAAEELYLREVSCQQPCAYRKTEYAS